MCSLYKAIWTSAEPVSPCLMAYSSITTDFRSTAIAKATSLAVITFGDLPAAEEKESQAGVCGARTKPGDAADRGPAAIETERV